MTQTIKYVLMDPTGNLTILVESPVPASLQPSIASQLMELKPETEQVGFISDGSTTDIVLRMAGGEFCGNASMCAGALYAMRAGLYEGNVSVQASGAELPVNVRIRSLSERKWSGIVSMPSPLSVQTAHFPDGSSLPTVRFKGISHVILEQKPNPAEAEINAPAWCSHLHADAIGLMFYDRSNEKLTPLVYVPSAGTICWENSCASGSSAVGMYLAFSSGITQHVSLHQPGGTLDVTASPEGEILLSGTTTLLETGCLQIKN